MLIAINIEKGQIWYYVSKCVFFFAIYYILARLHFWLDTELKQNYHLLALASETMEITFSNDILRTWIPLCGKSNKSS